MQKLNEIQNNYLMTTQTKLDSLSDEIANEGGISQRTIYLENGLSNITNNMVRPGSIVFAGMFSLFAKSDFSYLLK